MLTRRNIIQAYREPSVALSSLPAYAAWGAARAPFLAGMILLDLAINGIVTASRESFRDTLSIVVRPRRAHVGTRARRADKQSCTSSFD